DAVAPIVAVSKAAARITEDRRLYPPERIDQAFTDPVDVRNPRVLTHPYAVINNGPEVLGKMSVNVWFDSADRLIDQNVDAGISRPGRAGHCKSEPARHRKSGAQKLSAIDLTHEFCSLARLRAK